MGDRTLISWCDHTFNIWWGCDKISPGCDHCYAETFDHRLGGDHWGPIAPRRFFGDAYWRKPLAWNAAAEKAGVRASVFCSSMADWAEIHQVLDVRARQYAERRRLWSLVQSTPWLDWLLLSKRPENFAHLLPWSEDDAAGNQQWHEPLRNVWLMVTGENTEQLLRRTAILRQTPAWIRGISAEPLLEHITAATWDEALVPPHLGSRDGLIDWLIVGDESGHDRRPAQLDWVRTARESALRHRVAFHFKQWNGSGKTVHLPVLDNRVHDARPRSAQ